LLLTDAVTVQVRRVPGTGPLNWTSSRQPSESVDSVPRQTWFFRPSGWDCGHAASDSDCWSGDHPFHPGTWDWEIVVGFVISRWRAVSGSMRLPSG